MIDKDGWIREHIYVKDISKELIQKCMTDAYIWSYRLGLTELHYDPNYVPNNWLRFNTGYENIKEKKNVDIIRYIPTEEDEKMFKEYYKRGVDGEIIQEFLDGYGIRYTLKQLLNTDVELENPKYRETILNRINKIKQQLLQLNITYEDICMNA